MRAKNSWIYIRILIKLSCMSQLETLVVPQHPQAHEQEPVNTPIETHPSNEARAPVEKQQVVETHHQEENPPHHEQPKSQLQAHHEAKVEKKHEQAGHPSLLAPVQTHSNEIQKLVENNNVQQKVDPPKVKQNQVEKLKEANTPLIKEEVHHKHHQEQKKPQIHKQQETHANIPHSQQKVAAPVAQVQSIDPVKQNQKIKDIQEPVVLRKEEIKQQEHEKPTEQIKHEKEHPSVLHEEVLHPIQPQKPQIQSHEVVHQTHLTKDDKKDQQTEVPHLHQKEEAKDVKPIMILQSKEEKIEQKHGHIEEKSKVTEPIVQNHTHKQQKSALETEKPKLSAENIHSSHIEQPKHQTIVEPIKLNHEEHVHKEVKESKVEVLAHHQQTNQEKIESHIEIPKYNLAKQEIPPSKSAEQHEQHFQQQKIAPEHKIHKSDLHQIHQKIEQAEEHTQKQKYRLHSENVDSIHQERNQQKQVVLFTQFTQNDQPIHPKPDTHKVEQPKTQEHHVENSKEKPQAHSSKIVKTQTPQQSTLDAKPDKEHKTIDHLKEQLHQNNKSEGSPKRQSKDGIGKITKRTLHQKKVHDIIKDLHHYDEHKTMIPPLEQAKQSSKKKIDLSKLDTNIGIHSNVLNVTIGQIFNKVQEQQASRLLSEIEDLRKKLGELERRKEDRQYEPYERSIQPEEPEIQEKEQKAGPHDTINTAKSNKKQLTGRIYRKLHNGDSRLSEQVHVVSIQDRKSSVPIEPATISSANKQRFSSTNGFNNLRSGQKESESDFNRSAGISFRVRKANRSIQGMSEFQSGEKQAGFIRNRQKMEDDKCFQARIDDRFEKLEFSEEQKLVFIEKPAPRDLQFGYQFREQIEKYFIPLGDLMPKRDSTQQELVQLAKITFKKFGVNIQSQKKATLSVKKYKNCVSFILDTDRTILWYYEGKFYYGGWTISNAGEGEKNGWGYEWVPNKYVYSGGYRQNKRDGYGVIKFLSREKDIIYQGGWKNGFKEGEGKQIQPDDVEYVGSWLQGKKHGHGSVFISKQQNFTGHFIQGVKCGQGEEVFRNGDVYVGNYQDGKFNGKGIYTWANLSRYEGQFKDGSRNGSGLWVANYLDQNSDQYNGVYKNDKKNGYGVYKWKDGTSYQGQFLNDLKHGEGLVSYGDGRTATLQWFEGAVVPKQISEKSASGVKRGTSRGSSQKSENSVSKPQIRLGIEPKTKPTRISLGIEKI